MSDARPQADRDFEQLLNSPLWTAFQCGRAITRWRFFAVQEWFGRGEATALRQAAAEELDQQSRRLVSAVGRDAIQAIVRRWREDWEIIDGTEGLLQQRLETTADLEVAEREDESGRIWITEIERISAPVKSMASSLCEALTSNLDEAGLAAWSLGAWLEQGVCPDNVANELPGRPTAAIQGFGAGPTATDEGSRTARFNSSTEFQLAQRFFAPGELAAPQGWHNGLLQRWEELAKIRGDRALPALGMQGDARRPPAAYLKVVSAELASAIREAERPHLGQATGSASGYLGLSLKKETFTVHRQGLRHVLDLQEARLQFGILEILWQRRGGFTMPNQLTPAWEAYGRKSSPKQGTVSNEVSRLRSSLNILDITIQGGFEHGWRLSEISHEESL